MWLHSGIAWLWHSRWGHSHVAALTDALPTQHFRRLPLPQLHVLHGARRMGLRPPSVGRAQPPQLGRQISTNQDAASSHVAVDAALTVQVLLQEVHIKFKGHPKETTLCRPPNNDTVSTDSGDFTHEASRQTDRQTDEQKEGSRPNQPELRPLVLPWWWCSSPLCHTTTGRRHYPWVSGKHVRGTGVSRITSGVFKTFDIQRASDTERLCHDSLRFNGVDYWDFLPS